MTDWYQVGDRIESRFRLYTWWCVDLRPIIKDWITVGSHPTSEEGRVKLEFDDVSIDGMIDSFNWFNSME